MPIELPNEHNGRMHNLAFMSMHLHALYRTYVYICIVHIPLTPYFRSFSALAAGECEMRGAMTPINRRTTAIVVLDVCGQGVLSAFALSLSLSVSGILWPPPSSMIAALVDIECSTRMHSAVFCSGPYRLWSIST